MCIYSMPLNCTPKHGYDGQSLLCMFYQNFLKKGKGCSERTGEQTTAAQLWKLAIRLMSSWQVGAGSVTSRWLGEQSTGLVSTTEPSRRAGSLLLERGVGFTAGGAGLDQRNCISAPTSPFPLLGACCLTPLLKSGDLLFGKCESGGRVPSR